jgi:hypothetical protein
MNTKDFVQILKKVIKEEVKSAVQEAIRELSSDNLIESVVNKRKPDSNYTLKPEYNYKPKKVATKQFTKDPLLNSLLNETAASGYSIPPETAHNDFSEWPTMEMDNIGNSYASLMGSPKFVNNKINAIPDGINPNAVPEEVKGALTRDYRSLMKAINKKNGN